MSTSTASAHQWRFFRTGGFDQVKLGTGTDLANLEHLDQKLWVALACPTSGLEFDSKTLALVDADHDGRIRAPELIAAVKWACSMLKNPGDLIQGGDTLALSAVNDATPEGARLLASAKQVLTDLGKAGSPTLSLADASDAGRIFAGTTFNGDGVIIAESAPGDDTKAVIDDIAACMGSVQDRSGKPGIDQARCDAFFGECAAFAAWMKQADDDPAHILPAGERTPAASAAVNAIKPKVDDYFSRCRIAAFDPRAVPLLNRKDEEYAALATKDLSPDAAELAGYPLAQVAAGKPLPLVVGVNPAHAAALAALRDNAVETLLGHKQELTEADWSALQDRLRPFENWMAGKAGAAVEKLGLLRVRELLGGKAKDEIDALIAKDKALEAEAAAIADVERLILFQRDLYALCLNFVSFANFYCGVAPAIFQCGTLYLDQRECRLCVTVEDAGKHAAMAGLAGAYLAYCDCVRRDTGEKMSIAAIVSQGDDDNLMVGRNGIFYDRKGKDYDATITRIVSNPISLRQAFWLPYKKVVRMIDAMVAKRAAAAEAASDAKMAKAATQAAQADTTKPAEPKKIDVGTVAALGVAFGAIGTFLATLAGYAAGVLRLGPLAIIGAIIGIILVISAPSMILAYVKLRKRNLGPILDANGWAVNARARINVPFGTAMTGIAKLPPGAERELADRYAEKKPVWPWLVAAVLLLYLAYLVLDFFGMIYQWSGGRIGTPPS